MRLFEIGPGDVVDVLVVGSLLWAGLVWLRHTRARLAVPALVAVGIVYLVAGGLDLRLTAGILRGFFTVFLIVLVVVFQEDLRRLFERISAWGLRRGRIRAPRAAADVVARVATRMAETRTGGLLVFAGSEPLERHVDGGIELGGQISEPLLLSLFDPSSPGHDGAVLIEGDRVSRFAVHLPLSADHAQLGPGGTRHAAALGLAELTDALCVVVSEERGTISVARDGRLRLLRDPAELAGELASFSEKLRPAEPSSARWHRLRGAWREGLVGFGLATLLWTLLVPGGGQIEIQREVRVVVENLPDGYSVENVEPALVEATVRGRWRDLLLMDAATLQVRVDAFLVKLGRRTFEISAAELVHPPGVQVLAVEPDKVKLRVRGPGNGEAEPG
jgi:DNA integrity scanning protein DisA with diadenylate cyclase activity